MKQIKTIRDRLDRSEAFDDAVNAALRDGWQLLSRGLYRGIYDGQYSMLYAELEKEADDGGV